MERFFLYLLITIFTFHCLNSEASQSECGINETENDHLSLSITNRRNESGEWVTWFSASKNTSSATNNIDVFLARSSTARRGNHFINIKGSIKDSSVNDVDRRLFFHKKCSGNAAIINNGRTLNHLEGKSASALTHRPLTDDEVFTVRFDNKLNKAFSELVIGITTHSPEEIELPDSLYALKSGTWLLINTGIYQNSTLIRKDYAKTSLKGDIKVGQTIGVMKNKFGILHFFIDGVDQGPAASKIPDTVYGAIELYEDAKEGNIINV